MATKEKTKVAEVSTQTIPKKTVTKIVQFINNAGANGKFVNFVESASGVFHSVWISNENLVTFAKAANAPIAPGTEFTVLRTAMVKAFAPGTKPEEKRYMPETDGYLNKDGEFVAKRQQTLNPFVFATGVVGVTTPEPDTDAISI